MEVIAGPFAAATFAGIDLVALSPGVPKATPEIVAVDAPIVSEIELFAAGVREQAPASKIIAITGSNGKTTTTALTTHLLNAVGVTAVAVATSPSALDALMDAQDAAKSGKPLPEVWVVELSSFQLETTDHLDAEAATVLNVSEDHLDRYAGSLVRITPAKSRVFQGKGVMVLNRDDDWSMANGRCGRKMVTFGLDAAPRDADYGLNDGAIGKGKEAIVTV